MEQRKCNKEKVGMKSLRIVRTVGLDRTEESEEKDKCERTEGMNVQKHEEGESLRQICTGKKLKSG